MVRIKRWVGLMMLAGLLMACSGNIGSVLSDCSTDGVLLVDNFNEGETCGWYLFDDDSLTGAARIAGGKLEITSREPGQFWWSNPDISAEDVIVTATARKINGPDDNAFGLICRYQDANNFYLFLISSDGYYAIGKVISSSDEILYLSGGGEYQFSEVIQQGVQENTIRGSCEGDTLTLTVNGILLESVTDSSFTSGDIGVGVTAYEIGTAVVEFDDVRVIQP
ncbi:MAG: hypothetical protein AAGD96_18070 [Chloroflexota bacterium]